MKFSYLPYLIAFGIFLNAGAQEKSFYYNVELNAGLSANDALPFWMTANNFGKVPNSNYALATATFGKNFNETKNFSIAFKAAVTGAIANENNALINELYASVRSKKFRLDIGSKNDEIVFKGLSSSNGNITKSTNARAIPGYTLSTLGFIELPFAKKWLTFKARYGDYLLNDPRYVDNARLHAKSLFLKAQLNPTLDVVAGLNHYAQWAGTSPTGEKQPAGFKNYLKMVVASEGGSDALLTDQMNVLGNQLGSYLLQLNHQGTNTNWSLYWSHPFEDRSGMDLINGPDALYGFFIDLKKPKNILTHVLFEYTHTKHMSGSTPRNEGEGYLGMDNYFNNGVYKSGWTYFGNTLGSPYFTAETPDTQGVTNGVVKGDNRFTAVNMGFKGYLNKFQYKTMVSHVTYYGWFNDLYTPKHTQFSGYFEVVLPKIKRLPFQINIGTSFDISNYTSNNVGGFISLSKKGLF